MVLDTLEFGSKIKKTPVVVGNCTGFAVNRVFFPYTQARGAHLQPSRIAAPAQLRRLLEHHLQTAVLGQKDRMLACCRCARIASPQLPYPEALPCVQLECSTYC